MENESGIGLSSRPDLAAGANGAHEDRAWVRKKRTRSRNSKLPMLAALFAIDPYFKNF